MVETGVRFRNLLETEAQIYRLGGDEFVIILPEASETVAAASAKMIVENFQKSFLVKSYEINLTPSIGIALFPEHRKRAKIY